MAVTALSTEDCNALMAALESHSPGVRQARVAHALLLMAKGVPAPTVAEYLFLPEPVVCQYWQAFTLGRRAAPDAFQTGTGERSEETTLAAPRQAGPPRGLPGRRRWVHELGLSRAG